MKAQAAVVSMFLALLTLLLAAAVVGAFVLAVKTWGSWVLMGLVVLAMFGVLWAGIYWRIVDHRPGPYDR